MSGDWAELAIKAGVGLAGAIGGLFLGVWKWGRNSALAEQVIDKKISAVREEVRIEMAAHTQKIDDGNDLLVSQFKETLDGLRRQHDEMRVDVERRFLPKDDFRDWLKEYRDDQRRTDDKLDKLLEMKR